jgi:hypothetical protein
MPRVHHRPQNEIFRRQRAESKILICKGIMQSGNAAHLVFVAGWRMEAARAMFYKNAGGSQMADLKREPVGDSQSSCLKRGGFGKHICIGGVGVYEGVVSAWHEARGNAS